MTQSKFPKNGVMRKDKWNLLNLDFKKLSYYHTSISNHLSFWDFSFENKERLHLLHQFNKEYYEAIDAFMGEKIVTAPLHSKDVNAKRDKTYSPLA